MVITELYLKNFGMLSEKRIRLYDGIQVISGENEYGKSTIHAFIRAMLFGMERGRGRAAAKDDFSRYEPWDHPECYGGTMRFVCGGRSFRLERSFARPVRPAVLICEDDGEELSVEQGDLAMLLGGLTEGVFDSTVSVGQLKAEPGKTLSDVLENYAANYYETGNGEVDLNRALRILRERRRAAEKKAREEEAAQRERQQRLLQECRYLEQDMERLNCEYESCRESMKELRQERNRKTHVLEPQTNGQDTGEEPAKSEQEEGAESGISARSMLLAGAGGIFAGLIGFAWGMALGDMGQAGGAGAFAGLPSFPITVIGALIALAGAAVLVAGCLAWRKEKRRRKEKSRRNKESSQKEESRREEENSRKSGETSGQTEKAAEEERRLSWELERIRAEWKEKEIRCENRKEQLREIKESEGLREARRQCRVITLAEEEMEKAADETGSRTAHLINRRTSEIFSAVTDGKYQGVSVGQKMEISVWDGVRRIPAAGLSRGTLDQIYFAVRMAAADLILDEPMPVILDEVFAFYDEKRLKSALKWLSGQKKQVIIFTCHRREEEIMKKEDFS